MLDDKEAKVADLLFELGAIQFGAFRLKLHEKHPDAPLSPIYLNLRTANHPKNPGPLTDDAMDSIGWLFAGKIWETASPIDYIVGVPEAGEPFVDRTLNFMKWHPVVRVHLAKVVGKDGNRQIMPPVGHPVYEYGGCWVVDDLITQADSKLEAIHAIEGMNLTVRDVLVLVDRQQGGSKQLEQAGYRLHSIFQLEVLLHHYADRGFITPSKAAEVMYYITSNH